MPIYPPRSKPTKKVEILNNRISDFIKCVRQNSSDEKLLHKAERVRIAKLNLIKARMHLLSKYKEADESKSSTKLIQKLCKEQLTWEAITFEEIKGELI